jgi:hypothetical protein
VRNFSKVYQTNPSSSRVLAPCAIAIPVVAVAQEKKRRDRFQSQQKKERKKKESKQDLKPPPQH